MKNIKNAIARNAAGKTAYTVTHIEGYRASTEALPSAQTYKSLKQADLSAGRGERKPEMTAKYTLNHNMGETYFQTLRDAITAMYLIADYDRGCGADFDRTETEISRITDRVERGDYYENGIFALYVCQ